MGNPASVDLCSQPACPALGTTGHAHVPLTTLPLNFPLPPCSYSSGLEPQPFTAWFSPDTPLTFDIRPAKGMLYPRPPPHIHSPPQGFAGKLQNLYCPCCSVRCFGHGRGQFNGEAFLIPHPLLIHCDFITSLHRCSRCSGHRAWHFTQPALRWHPLRLPHLPHLPQSHLTAPGGPTGWGSPRSHVHLPRFWQGGARQAVCADARYAVQVS